MKTIVQNLAVEYTDEGSGPVILMLHGWKDSLHSFDAFAPELSKTHRVVRLDMPGFGQSDMPKGTWGVSEYVEFVKSFIAKLGLEVDVILGHSFGGRVILKGVGSGVLHANKVILIAAAGLGRKKKPINYVFVALGKVGRALTLVPPLSLWRTQLRRKIYTALGSDYFAAGALKHTFVKILKENLREYAMRIAIPTLIVWGEHDVSTPLWQGKLAHELIEDSQFIVIKDAGHFVHHEKKDEVLELIKKFI